MLIFTSVGICFSIVFSFDVILLFFFSISCILRAICAIAHRFNSKFNYQTVS